MTVEIVGAAQMKANLKLYAAILSKEIDDAVRVTAFRTMKTAIKDIRTPSMGREVKRGKKTHTVSKEGDAPNTDTGNLIGSINLEHLPGSQVAEVGTNLEYGLFLETSLNRPWLNPALEKNIGTLQKMVVKALRKSADKIAL